MRYLMTRTPARLILALVLVLVTSVLVVRASDFVGGPVEATDSPAPSTELAEATATPTDTPTATPTDVPSPTEEPAPTFKLNGGGGKNIVIAKNHQDGQFLVRGRLDLNQVNARRLAPVNFAYAMGYNCNGCTTLAIAGQIVLYKPDPAVAAPQNAAVAVNAACNGCVTGAWAIQYFIPVEDVNTVPPDVDAFVRALDAELRGIEHDAKQGNVTLQQAIERLDSVLARFRAKGDELRDRQVQIETNADTPSPYPSEPPEPSESPSDSASDTPAATEAPTETPASP
jgi:hypothetical protein